ncbi:MAG: peptide chain release factor N(5)-glutamine methyltransferase [Gammaproteobacteria bacterium]
MTISIQAALDAAVACLRADSSAADTAALDARVLLCAVLGKNQAFLIAHDQDALTRQQSADYDRHVQRRADGEPIAYIVGQREFWSLALDVTTATLIPRPETETLVQAVLTCVKDQTAPRILELGTGTGAIVLALATERPDATLMATDRDEKTLAVARGNGERLAPDRVDWRSGDWFEAVDGEATFCAIVSNPPYIAPNDPHLIEGDVRFEPDGALCAAEQGMADLIHIIDHASSYLQPAGWLLVEHGYDQAEAVQHRFERAGFQSVRLERDLAGQPRVTLGRRR